MTKRRLGAVLVLGLIGVAFVSATVLIAEPWVSANEQESAVVVRAAETLTSSSTAVAVYDSVRSELVVLHGPVDLPGSAGAHGHGAHGTNEAAFPDVAEITVPLDGYVSAFYVDLVDGQGNALPSDLLHHVNLIDPDQRELFAPISMRFIAAGRETGVKQVPPRLFGLPVRQGQRLAVHTMLHNPTALDYRSVVLHVHLRVSPRASGSPVWPVYPFWVDVQLPAGDKTFDLPPGRSSRSYEAQPAVEGRVLALSGHAHDYATALRFENATTGEVLWEAVPEVDVDGAIIGVPTGRPFLHLGEPLHTGQTYRLTVDYDNPTGDTIPDGGMGSIGGIFLPDGSAMWPRIDPTNELYHLDLRHYFRELQGKLEQIRAAAS